MSTQVSGNTFDTLQNKHTSTLDELKKYKLLVDSVEDYAIFLMDTEGYIQTWNKGAEKNKGYKSREIIGKHFSNFYLERDKQAKKPERELELAKRFGRVEDEDWRVKKDGGKFWANVVITALYDEDKNLVGFAKVTRNLTERKQHEDALRDANKLLRRQQRELEALNISKDEFVSLASHQLRTPATGIKQLLGLLLEGFSGELTSEHRTILERAYLSNERQLSIVNSLLKVAQVDAGKVILKKQPANIAKLLKTLALAQANSFKVRKQTLVLDTESAKNATALLDIDYIRMVLENILDNASKYTHTHGKITIKLVQDVDTVAISISDTGVGIAKKDIDRLFKRFSRVSNELSTSVGGSGLGLYWAYKVVSLHGGSIQVTSVPDKGTTFKVVLPKGAVGA